MLKNQKGFSLVELMIVVAIIGILAAIAIPNYQKFQEKSRQSEATSNLGALYTAEAAFMGEYNQYYGAFDATGFSASGNLNYNIGFGKDGTSGAPPAGAPKGTAACITLTDATGAKSGCPATYVTWGLTVNGTGATAIVGGAAYTLAAAGAGQTFTAGASGMISNAAKAVADVWTMDQNKVLSNAISGL